MFACLSNFSNFRREICSQSSSCRFGARHNGFSSVRAIWTDFSTRQFCFWWVNCGPELTWCKIHDNPAVQSCESCTSKLIFYKCACRLAYFLLPTDIFPLDMKYWVDRCHQRNQDSNFNTLLPKNICSESRDIFLYVSAILLNDTTSKFHKKQ